MSNLLTDTVYKIATRLRLRTWIFFNIASKFDSYEIHSGMIDIKSYIDEI